MVVSRVGDDERYARPVNEVAQCPGDRRRYRADQKIDPVAKDELLRLTKADARFSFGVLADHDDLATTDLTAKGVEAKIQRIGNLNPQAGEHPRVREQRADLDGLRRACARNCSK